MRKNLKTVLTMLACIVLGACTALTKTSGTKLSEPSTPINSIGVVLAQGTFAQAPGLVTFVATKSLNELFPLLPNRMPVVFANHGIKNKTIVISSSLQEKSSIEYADLQAYQYLLVISPTSAQYVPYGGNITIYMDAKLFDRNKKKILWTGSVSVFKDGTSKINDEAADNFANKLLEQLERDGMLQLTENNE